MEKIIYLARKLKVFTFNDIFLLAETSKEELKNSLQKLVKEGVLKNTNQGFIFGKFKQIPPPAEPAVKSAKTRFINEKDFIKFDEVTIPDIKN